MGNGVWEYGAMRNRGMGHGEWSMEYGATYEE